jgi:Flp pilus assembly protein protease CpaA
MRVLGVMALPLLLLAFDFWLLYDAGLDGYSYGKETGRKQRGFVLYLIISAILLLVLAGRLIWDCPEQSILFQCKRVSCLAMLFVAAATDYRRQIIPNRLILSGLGFRAVLLLAELVFERDVLIMTLFSEVLGAIGIFIVCMVFLLMMKNSIGMGDIKLFMVMGLYLGLYSMIDAIMSSLVLAFVCAIVLLLMRKKGKKDSLPFAPAVLAGTYLSVFLTGI